MRPTTRIVIPTRGRVGRQITLERLPPALRERTTVVAPSQECAAHKWRFPEIDAMPQPDAEWTIARKRRWILDTLAVEHGWEEIIMLDDDMQFSQRRSDEPDRFLVAKPEEVIAGFGELSQRLCPEVPHAGFAVRMGANRKPEHGWIGVGRNMYSLGYHVPTVLANAELGRIETREDMDLTLQLLRKGLRNDVYNTLVTQQEFGSKGGCTGERTIASSDADAHRLAELFPGYVRLSAKQYKNSPQRLEVVCLWQKAYEDAINGR